MSNLRTYGTTTDESGNITWSEVQTDANGFSDAVYLTTLCQVLKLNRGESPFYGNYGIPTMQSLQTGIPPNLYVAQTQQQFAPYFAALTVQMATIQGGNPVYNIGVITHTGAVLSASVPI